MKRRASRRRLSAGDEIARRTGGISTPVRGGVSSIAVIVSSRPRFLPRSRRHERLRRPARDHSTTRSRPEALSGTAPARAVFPGNQADTFNEGKLAMTKNWLFRYYGSQMTEAQAHQEMANDLAAVKRGKLSEDEAR